MYEKDDLDFKGHPSKNKSCFTLSNAAYTALLIAVFFLGAFFSRLQNSSNGQTAPAEVLFQSKTDTQNALAIDDLTPISSISKSISVSSSSPQSSTASSSLRSSLHSSGTDSNSQNNNDKLLSVLTPAESELESAFADFTLAQARMNNELSRELHELRQRVHIVEKIILLNKDKFVVSKSAILSAAQAEAAQHIQNTVERTENEIHSEESQKEQSITQTSSQHSQSPSQSQSSSQTQLHQSQVPTATTATLVEKSSFSVPTTQEDIIKTCDEMKVQYKVSVGHHWGELPANLQKMWKEIGCDKFTK